MRRELVVVCVVLTCIALASAGCVQITPTPEPATVAFACEARDDSYYGPLIEAFEKEHRHITIECVRPQRYSFAGLDVLELSPFVTRFLDDAELDLLDLTFFVEQGESFDRQDYYPGLMDMFTTEEEIWAIPSVVDLDVMYYNRDLLDRYRAPTPQPDWTWDDFVQIANTMYDPLNGVYGYVLDEQHDDVFALVYQHGGRLFDDLGEPTRTTYDDPLTIEAVEWYAKLMHEYQAAPTPQEARQAYGLAGYVQTGIREGRVGMWSAPISEAGRDAQGEAWDVEWGMVPLPRGKTSASLGFAVGYAIRADAEFPDACWAWIAFLSQQVPRAGIPVRRSVIESKAYEEQVGDEEAATARASIEHALFLSPAGWDTYGTLQYFTDAVRKVSADLATPLEALTEAQQRSPYK